MLRKFFVHEVRQLVSDHVLPVAAVALIVVLGFGLWNGQRWVAHQERVIGLAIQQQATALERAKAQAERIRAGQEETVWWSSAADIRGFVHSHLVSFASKPPAPLSSLAVGQSDIYPFVLKVDPETRSGQGDAYENINVRKLLLGPFDLAFVIIYFLPLFILTLCYDVLAGEKERGILGLLAAQPVSLTHIVFLKVGIRIGLVIAIIVLVLGSILLLSGLPVNGAETAERLAMWFAVVFAYSLFWFLLGVLVISRGWRSATNALVLSGAWLVLVVLVPIAVNAWITTAYPLPSRVEFIKTLRDIEESVRKDKDHVTSEFFAEHPELRPATKADEKAATRPAIQREIGRRIGIAEAAFVAQLARQQDLAERLSFLSPALLVHSAFLDLTGTGLTRHRDFVGQVARYHAELDAYFTPKIVKQEYDFTGYDEFPRFRYRPPGLESLEPAFVAIAALAGAAFGLGAASLPGLRRYPVTPQ